MKEYGTRRSEHGRKRRSFGKGGGGLLGGGWRWEEGEELRILNSRLSLLLLGRPAALMKTSEQTDCPTLLESRGQERERERKTKKWEGDDETNWPKARLKPSWFWT